MCRRGHETKTQYKKKKKKKNKQVNLSADGDGEPLDVDDDVEHGLADVRVELGDAGAEALHVRRQKLVRIRDAVVQIVHLVVRKVPVQRPTKTVKT